MSLDPKYHSSIIFKNKVENENFQPPILIPPKPNRNDEPPDRGDKDVEKVGEDSSDSE